MKEAFGHLNPELAKSMQKGEMAAATAITEGRGISLIDDTGLEHSEFAYAVGWNSVVRKKHAVQNKKL